MVSKVVVDSVPGIATHHASFTDGNRTLGLIFVNAKGEADPLAIRKDPINRTALKTTSGNQKYSDFEPPWSPAAQDNFMGGRGIDDYDKDITRYADGYRVNTTLGYAILGPRDTYTTGYRNQVFSLPGSVSWTALISTRKSMAVKFTANANFDIQTIYMHLKRRGTPTTAITISLCSDTLGSPGSVLLTDTITTTDIPDVISVMYKQTFDTSQAVTNGVSYWIVVASDGDSDNHWQVGIKNVAGTSKQSSNGTTWIDSTVDLYYRVTDADTVWKKYLFQYRYMQYMYAQKSGEAPKIYINGDRGLADANTGALTTLVDATKSWAVNQYAGKKVMLIAGPGSNEETSWRTIVSNTATALTVSPAWEIEHTTATEYVILGDTTWTEVTGHGITKPITCVKVVNEICYFCQGDATNVRRMTYTAGAHAWADDGTNKATFMETVRDSTDGLIIWRANNLDANSKRSIQRAAAVVAWPNNLTYSAAAVPIYEPVGQITNIIEYGDTVKQLWIMTEGTVFYTASQTMLDEIPLRELRTMMASTNGKAAMVHNAYLFFTMGNGVERYYARTLDDVGPNRDEGFPADRQGPISCMVGYPGRYILAVDGGSTGYSSILMESTGYHELYRAPALGERITAMQYQTLPGESHRLWVCVGNDVIYLPFPEKTLNPLHDNTYAYTHESVITSGYIYAGLYDAQKLFDRIKTFTEGLSEDAQWIEIDYRLDDDTAWTSIKEPLDASPVDELILGERGVTGRRLQWRARMNTNNVNISPRLKTVVVENISRVATKHSVSFMVRLADSDHNLLGDRDTQSALEKQELLDEWADNITPLTLRCYDPDFDNMRIFLNPSPGRPYKHTMPGRLLTITGVET